MVRGTRGYLAPEWVSNHPITVKADVYNYGMLLLEIIGGRRNLDMSFGAEDFFYPGSAYKDVAAKCKVSWLLFSIVIFPVNPDKILQLLLLYEFDHLLVALVLNPQLRNQYLQTYVRKIQLFGTMYKRKLNDGTLVAIKHVKKDLQNKNLAEFKNEINTLSKI
ncbi:probable serine/threonine-protein kinase PBL19 [Glycine soja]|nr:probable serine/threonine-protein kinase PBL19 [Glycine soja]